MDETRNICSDGMHRSIAQRIHLARHSLFVGKATQAKETQAKTRIDFQGSSALENNELFFVPFLGKKSMGNPVIPLLTIEETYEKFKENRNVVLSDKVVEGTFQFYKRTPNERDRGRGPKSIAIYKIFLDPLYQRTGILTRLIKRMIDDGYEEIAILAMSTATG